MDTLNQSLNHPFSGLEVRELVKSFGPLSPVLKGVSLRVPCSQLTALVGENGAGKSTLIKCIAGMVRPESGSLVWHPHSQDSALYPPLSPSLPTIGLVHQHFLLAEAMTALENLTLAFIKPPRSLWGLERMPSAQSLKMHFEDLMNSSGLHVPLDAPVCSLNVVQKQRIEILKALCNKPKLLILDEPTALLPYEEVLPFYALLQKLAQQEQCAVLIVTHKLAEVSDFCNHVVVLTKGRIALQKPVADLTPQTIAAAMVGAEQSAAQDYGANPTSPASRPHPPSVALELEGFCASGSPEKTGQREISLRIYGHEIVGVAGLDGSGQRELLETLVGVSGHTRYRTLTLWGQNAHSLKPWQRWDRGLRWLGDDRLLNSCFPQMPPDMNLYFGGIQGFPPLYYLGFPGKYRSKNKAHLRDIFLEGGVEPPLPALPRLADYSGGNQQKFLVSALTHEHRTSPRLLLLPYSTRGVDWRHTELLKKNIKTCAARGDAVLVFDSDLDELLSICHRIVVLFSGKFVGVVESHEKNPKQQLGAFMTGMGLSVGNNG